MPRLRLQAAAALVLLLFVSALAGASYAMTELHDHSPEALLKARGVRCTAVRILCLRALLEAECALSLSDIEARTTVDKSSAFRSLTLFLAHHLVHAVEDGTGQTKYAPCAPQCHCGEDVHAGLSDLHTHFFCERCRRTFCLRGLPVPSVTLPDGFHLHSANYVLKGLCPACCRKAKCAHE